MSETTHTSHGVAVGEVWTGEKPGASPDDEDADLTAKERFDLLQKALSTLFFVGLGYVSKFLVRGALVTTSARPCL